MQPAWIVGWGVTEEEALIPPETLRNVRVKIYEGTQCDLVMEEKKKDWNSQICAGSHNFQWHLRVHIRINVHIS